MGGRGEGIAVNGFLDTAQQRLAAGPQLAAEDDRGRAQEGAQIGEDATEDTAALGDDPSSDRIDTDRRERAGGSVGHTREAELGELPVHLGDGYDGLQAAEVPAAAQTVGTGQLDVTDLAGCAGCAPVHLAVEHQAGADTVRSLDVDEVTASASGSEAAFAVGAHLGVVADMDRL